GLRGRFRVRQGAAESLGLLVWGAGESPGSGSLLADSGGELLPGQGRVSRRAEQGVELAGALRLACGWGRGLVRGVADVRGPCVLSVLLGGARQRVPGGVPVAADPGLLGNARLEERGDSRADGSGGAGALAGGASAQDLPSEVDPRRHERRQIRRRRRARYPANA